MKKTLAVILSLVMLLCCIPFTANAEEDPVSSYVEWDANHEIKTSDEMKSNVSYKIKSGHVLTVASNVTAYVPVDSILTIEAGATLRVYGTLVVLGTLKVEGRIDSGSAEKITVDKMAGGSSFVDIRFPALTDAGLTGKIEVSYALSKTGNPYEDIDAEFIDVPATGDTIHAEINEYVFIKAHIIEPDGTDKYDDALMQVYANGMPQKYGQGVYNYKAVSAADIAYSPWVNDDYFLSTFNIYLPTGEGYTVYGREGEQSALGETVKLKYGQTFSFKVEIDPEYDMSAYEVYIYNGYGWTNLDPSQELADIEPAKPDKYGYYTIDAIQGEHTVYVVGVVANETLLMVGNILDMVRNVFEMIATFFAEIFAFLGFAA